MEITVKERKPIFFSLAALVVLGIIFAAGSLYVTFNYIPELSFKRWFMLKIMDIPEMIAFQPKATLAPHLVGTVITVVVATLLWAYRRYKIKGTDKKLYNMNVNLNIINSIFMIVTSIIAIGYYIKWDGFYKGLLDENTYEYMTLPNGMRAMVVHTPGRSETCFSLSVAAGWFDDPPELPGLAHLTEHMVFGHELDSNIGVKTEDGTAKDEGDFGKYVLSNGGTYNASTDNDTTSYYFSVPNDHFSKSLELMANSLKEPKIEKGFLEREIKVIDEEWQRQNNNPIFRVQGVSSDLYNSEDPASKFMTGNSETFRRNDIKEQIMNFHEKHYKASRMAIVLQSAESIATSKALIQEHFKGFKKHEETFERKAVNVPKILNTNQYIKVEGYGQERYIAFKFHVPYSVIEWKKNPSNLLQFAIMHPSHNWLTDHLRKENVAKSVEFFSLERTQGYQVFVLTVQLRHSNDLLSDEKLQKTIQLVKAFIENLKANGIPQGIIDEFMLLNKKQFMYNKRGGLHFGSKISEEILKIPDTNEIKSIFLYDEWAGPNWTNTNFKKVCKDAFEWKNTIIGVIADFDIDNNWLKSRHHGVPYIPVTLSNTTLPKLELTLQDKLIEFIATDIFPRALVHSSEYPRSPTHIKESGIYHLLEKHFKETTVKMTVFMVPTIPIADKKFAKFKAIERVLTEYLDDYFTPLNSKVVPLGASVSVSCHYKTLEITIFGTPDQVKLLAPTVARKLNRIDWNTEMFMDARLSSEKSWIDTHQGEPEETAKEIFKAVVTEGIKLDNTGLEIPTIKLEEIEKYFNRLTTSFKTESFVYGNANESEAIKFVDSFQKGLKGKYREALKSEPTRLQPLEPELEENENIVPIKSLTAKTSGTLYCIKVNDELEKKSEAKVMIAFLRKHCQASFSEFIRIEKNVAYVEKIGRTESQNSAFLAFYTESSKVKASELSTIIEEFIKTKIESLSEKSFNEMKLAYIQEMQTPYSNSSDDYNDYYGKFQSGQMNFLQASEQASIAKNLEFSEFKTFLNDVKESKFRSIIVEVSAKDNT